MEQWKNIIVNAIFVLLCVLTVAGVSGCGRTDKKEMVLASIGGEVIRVADFEERISNLPARYQDVVRKKKGEYLEELVNDTLLYQEAIRGGLHKDPEVKGVIQEAKKKILVARLLKDRVDDVIEITDGDVSEYYEQHKEDYMTPEVMRVSHILVPTRKEAEDVMASLSSGADFEETAKAKSVDPTAQRGGDIGYFPKGQLMTEFENACSGLEINEISGIVRTKLGYHIIKLTDRRLPEQRSSDQVSEKIREEVRTLKRRQLFNGLLEGLRNSTEIIINEKALSG
ncbi:MAG: peptidylprolyl isomerase [Candidatus Omnitrophota bacterium]|nr:peptidylprolyl isomerase [Candidatus Omnitrophota bacterium]